MPDYRKVHYRVDVRDVKREVHRVGDQPDTRAIAAFEDILERFWRQTQQRVHAVGESPGGDLRTGSLKHSGERDSYWRNKQWHGRIRYGGQIKDGWPGNPGVIHGPGDGISREHAVHNPVKYAEFERERGEEHDYMRGMDKLNNAYYRAIRDAL